MKNFFALLAFLAPLVLFAQPCTTTNSAGCDCLDGSTDCDLLPDMRVSRDLLMDPSENPETPGELGVSVSSPNVGHGPLRIVATDYYICGTDTVYSPGGYTGSCPDGSDPRQMIKQRIYHKNSDGTMTYSDRWAGSMTYHATHGHMHVDDWGEYSLRNEVPGTDPLTWPIVAQGAKLGFCLMDYGSCNYYYGHCRDAADAILTTDAPNYGLGGGGYSCGMTNQGISAGWTDIYHYYLDGMQIPIPPTVCNGDYMLVVELDPNNNFLEEDETNNVEVVPITLTEQVGIGVFDVQISSGSTVVCQGETIELSVPVLGTGYSWSTGETSSTIMVSESGTYSVTVNTTCGDYTSQDLEIEVFEIDMPIVNGDSVCESGAMTLTATGIGNLTWFDAITGGTELGTGGTFNTPVLSSTTSYWVESDDLMEGPIGFSNPHGHLSPGSLYAGDTYNGYLVFDAYADFTLNSVKVYTDIDGDREIELRNSSGTVIASKLVNIPIGESRVDLSFSIPAGTDYELGTNTAVNNTSFGFESPRLQRSNSGVTYPYDFESVVAITDSRAGSDFYYYFYDWEIKVDDIICESPREEVIALVRVCVTGIEEDFNGVFELYPNPTSGLVNMSFTVNGSQDLTLSVIDLSGKVYQVEQRNEQNGLISWTVDMHRWSRGAYIVEIQSAHSTLREMVILE
ncbi:MAG: hypothetical protein ACI959_000150 [Limisphaerales bacterium]|jgi:hypothetical protein